VVEFRHSISQIGYGIHPKLAIWVEHKYYIYITVFIYPYFFSCRYEMYYIKIPKEGKEDE
jgi:hypothetical protein